MKLKCKEYVSKKDGQTKQMYKINSIDKDGFGLPVEYKMDITFVFEPLKNKFGGINAVIMWNNIPQECTQYINEFQNLFVELPKSFAKYISMSGMKGKRFIISTKSFTNENGELINYLVLDNPVSSFSKTQTITTVEELIKYHITQKEQFITEFKVSGYSIPEKFLLEIQQYEFVKKLDAGQQIAIYYAILSRL